MKKVTLKTVVKVWMFMLSRYHTTVYYKPTNKRMKRLRRLVQLFRIMSAKMFDKFSMTLGKDVFVNYKFRNKANKSKYYSIRIENGVHEHVHAYDGISKWRYLTSKKYRFEKEVRAYKANIVMRWHLTGEFLDPDRLARLLKKYRCTDAQIRQAAREYRQVVVILKRVNRKGFNTFHPVIKDVLHYLWSEEL